MKIIPPLTDEQKRARDRALSPQTIKCGECGMTWQENRPVMMDCRNRYCPVALPRSISGLSVDDYRQWLGTQQQQQDACRQCKGRGRDGGGICDLCNGSGRRNP